MATKINKILVTGSDGFIGTHLMEKLGVRGIQYDIASNKYADILSPEMLESVIVALRPKAIIHLAAVSNLQDARKNPELAIKTNILGSFNVMKLAAKYKIRVILASSAAAAQPEISIYGMTKKAMEDLAMFTDGVVVARFYNVYGEGSKSFVNNFVKRAKQGNVIRLNGNTRRDYIHVDDIVDQLIDLADWDLKYFKSGTSYVDLGTGKATTLRQLTDIIEKVMDRKLKISQGPSIDEIQKSVCLTPYTKCKVTLKEGIRRML